jgi:hydroxypyruvate reductase
MRQVALLTRQWPQASHAILNELCETRMLMPGAELSGDFFRTFNSDVTILCTSFLDEISTELVDALPGLRLVAHVGTWRGPQAPFAERGLCVADSGPAAAGEAADFVLTQLLAACRRTTLPLPESGAKRTLDQGLARSVSGLKVGLAGYDAVAAELARRCRALDMQVQCWSLEADALPGWLPRTERLEWLASWCDVLSLHGASGEALVTPTLLAQCSRDAVLVNATDPRLIDEPALIEALHDYRLAAAALDVCGNEQALARCPNVLLTPQLATNTMTARQQLAERVIANIRAWLAGQPLPDQVI